MAVIRPIPDIDGVPSGLPVPITEGGTGAATLSAAKSALGTFYTIVSTEAELNTAISEANPMIYIDTDMTFTANKTLTADTEIKLGPNVIVDFDDFYIETSLNVKFRLCGEPASEINYANTSGNDVIFINGNHIIDIDGLIINEGATSNGGFITSDPNITIRNCTINFANNNTNMILVGSDENMVFQNLVLNGGGASCQDKIDLSGSPAGAAIFDNIYIDGTWVASPSFGLTFTGSANNIVTSATMAIRFYGCKASGVHQAAGQLDISATLGGGGTYSAISNFECDDLVSTTLASFSNGRVAAAASLGSPNAMFTNVYFQSGVTVNAVDDVGLVNCRCGSGTGTGVTITVNAGSDRTRISGCTTDAAISDAGTGTVVSANTVRP